MYNHSFHSTNFLYVHIFLLVLINILKQAAEVQATQPNLNRNQKMFSANSPPHSFHSSNLYNNKDTDVNIVEELSIDPSFWNWKVTESPAWAIVLYAPWCGHCQHFVNTWEEYARKTLGAPCDTIKGQYKIKIGAINCVAHEDICNNHDMNSYPTLLLMWNDDHNPTPETTTKVREVKLEKRTVPELILETKKTLQCQTFHQLNEINSEHDKSNLRGNSVIISTTQKMANRINVESFILSDKVEDALRALKFSMLQIYVGRKKLSNIEYNALINWLNSLLLSSHAIFSSKIYSSLRQLLVELNSMKDHTNTEEKEFVNLLKKTNLLSGRDTVISLSTKGWKSCRDASNTGDINIFSSNNNNNNNHNNHDNHKRGFTCGLWTLFHLMASNAPSENSEIIVAGIVDFIQYFFRCKECSNHFMKEFGTLNFIQKYKATKSSYGATEWLWRSHNSVNERLRKLEPTHSIWMLPFPNCNQCKECCLDVASGVTSNTLNEEVTIKYVKDLYCVDRSKKDFKCINGERQWTSYVQSNIIARDIEMKNYRSGFWIVASALIIIFVLCNARKNIRKYLGKTK